MAADVDTGRAHQGAMVLLGVIGAGASPPVVVATPKRWMLNCPPQRASGRKV